MNRIKTLLIMLLLVNLLAVSHATTDNEIKAARKILADNEQAVIGIRATLKMEMYGRSNDMIIEALGTVIDSSGLTITSSATIDPVSMYQNMSGAGDGDDAPKSELSDVKLILANGDEVPAEVVMKDTDLDMSFLMPKKEKDKPARIFQHVKLHADSKVEVLDSIVTILRLGKSMDRQPSVGIGFVSALVTKPRPFISFEGVGADGVGTPSFNLQGQAIGISLVRQAPASSTVSLMAPGGQFYVIILPARDVLEVAEQAKEVVKERAEEK